MASTAPVTRSVREERERLARNDSTLGMVLLWIGPAVAFVLALLWGW